MNTIDTVELHQNPTDWRARLHLGAYTTTEAAWLAGTTRQMIVTWWRIAYGYTVALSSAPPTSPILLSCLQLVESVVAITLRTSDVSFVDIRSIHDTLRERFGKAHPFANSEMRETWLSLLQNPPTFGPAKGQTYWKRELQTRLAQFEYEDGCALRWYPRGRDGIVVVDPRIAFGAPTIAGTGVALHIIQERLASGESNAAIADDFGLTDEQIEAVTALTRPRTHRAA